MNRLTQFTILTTVLLLIVSGCSIPEKAIYDASLSSNLGNLNVVDAREAGNPLGTITSIDSRRRYLSEDALGPKLIDILRSRLSAYGKALVRPKSVSILGIEISLIPVDNSMEENVNDPGSGEYGMVPVFVSGVGTVPIFFGPTSNESLVSVRTVIQFSSEQEYHEVTEYGMSTRSKVQPEIQKVYYKAIDQLAKRL